MQTAAPIAACVMYSRFRATGLLPRDTNLASQPPMTYGSSDTVALAALAPPRHRAARITMTATAAWRARNMVEGVWVAGRGLQAETRTHRLWWL